MKKILILHNTVHGDAPDETDVLAQRDLVRESCLKLGYAVISMALGEDIAGDMRRIRETLPDLVFNLTEAVFGRSELLYLAPAMLESISIPFTGASAESLFLTTNKVLAKKMLRLQRLPTPDFFTLDEIDRLDGTKRYIAKPLGEEASVGISEALVFRPDEGEKSNKIGQLPARRYFIEEYIEGREFNISMLAKRQGMEILPPAEMLFGDYFKGRPKILGYKAKWDKNSPEYRESQRVFGTLKKDSILEKELLDVCRSCVELFGLRGYARVDLRVDQAGRIYILEINGNPCIAPDSGFVAALHEAGYGIESMIQRIIEDAE